MARTTFKNDMHITGALTVAGAISGSGEMTPGAGTSLAETYQSWTVTEGGIIKTSILIDLTGLNCGGTAGDIIGNDGAGVAYIGQVTAAVNGTIFKGAMTCLETPAGASGSNDIDIYSATEGTGVEDTAIGDLTETQLVNAGASTLGTTDVFSAFPAADSYLYLVGQGAAGGTYTAGRLLVEMWGHQL